jgi:ATP-binding cassette subfamily C protein CydD
VVGDASTVGRWAFLSWVAESALGGQGGADLAPGLVGFAVLGAVSVWARRASTRATEAGRLVVLAHIRLRVTSVLLPDRSGPRIQDSSADASALLDLADDVAAYHSRVGPLHGSTAFSMGLVLAAVAAVQWPVAVVLLIASALMPMNMRLAGLVAADESRRQLRALRRLSGLVLDNYRGMRTIRGFEAVESQKHLLVRASEALNKQTGALLKKAFLSGLVMDAVVTFALAVSATYVGFVLLDYVRVPGAQPLELASGLFVLLLCPIFFLPIRQIAAGYHDRDRAMAAAEVLSTLAEGATDVDDAATAVVRTSPPVAVSLQAVTHRPDPGGPAVLEDADMLFEAGRWTAVTGRSGAGKTTLLSLIVGVAAPDAGVVVWQDPSSGERITPSPTAASWIGQQTVIIDGTLSDNILLGSREASSAAVAEAASVAGLADLIDALPDGLDTHVGDQGWGVSAGEARRIAIARAVLRDSGLWVLDEPTAHLDPETEAEVLAALLEATRGRTVIVATHSPAVAQRSDRLLDLDQMAQTVGQVVLR